MNEEPLFGHYEQDRDNIIELSFQLSITNANGLILKKKNSFQELVCFHSKLMEKYPTRCSNKRRISNGFIYSSIFLKTFFN